MPTQHHWFVRPGAFVLCLLCGLGAAIVVIEALRGEQRQGLPQYDEVFAPLAVRMQQPFPRRVRDGSGTTLLIPRPPQRMVSQTLGTDEILLAICAPQRLMALSTLVDDAQFSNVTALAQHVAGRTNAGAEQILHFQPDLVFVASYSKAELVALLSAARAPVFRLTHFNHLDDIKRNIRTIGYMIGADDNAEALVQQMEHTLAMVRDSIPPDVLPVRVLWYGQAGYTGGAHTTFDDMVQAVGATNVAAAHGISGFRKISNEQLIQWNPEVIIASADRHALHDTRQQLLHDPAVAVTTAGKQQRIIVLPNHMFSTVTHHITQGIELLARQLYELKS